MNFATDSMLEPIVLPSLQVLVLAQLVIFAESCHHLYHTLSSL